MRLRVLLVLATVLAAAPVPGADISSVTVEHRDGTYRSSVTGVVDASPSALRDILADFDNYTLLNPNIRESVVLAENTRTGGLRVRFVYRACILFLCRDLRYTVDFLISEFAATGTILPDDGDFRTGTMGWDVQQGSSPTMFHAESSFEPAFWVPPIIGPFLIKRTLRREAEATIVNVERMAAGEPEYP